MYQFEMHQFRVELSYCMGDCKTHLPRITVVGIRLKAVVEKDSGERGNHNHKSHLLVDGSHYGRPYPHAQFEPYVVEGLEEEGVSQGGEEETAGVHVPDPVRGGGVPREHDQLSANRVYAIKDRARWFAAKLGKMIYLHNKMSDYKMQYTILKEINCSIL